MLFLKEEVEDTVLPGTGATVPAPKLAPRKAEAPGTLAFSGSAMPTGLLDDLSLQAVRDLLAFLQQLGVPGGLNASNPHVARQWRIESDAAERPGDSNDRDAPTGGTGEVTSLINGDLRRQDCLDQLYDTDRDRTFYIASYFAVSEVVRAPIHLTFTGVSKAWLDGKAVAIDRLPVELSVAPGRHRIDIRLVPSQMPPRIRVECPEVEFSTKPLYPSE